MMRLRLVHKLVIGLLLGVALRWMDGDGTKATHLHDPHDHLGSILSTAVDEDVCVEMHDDSIDANYAIGYVVGVLSNSQGWENTRWIDFKFRGYPCGTPDNPYEPPPAGQGIEIAINFRHDWDEGPCPDQTIGCEISAGEYWPPNRGHAKSEWLISRVYVDSDRFDDPEGIHLLNHEVGHSFGLCDGEPIGYTLAYPVNAWDGWVTAGVHLEERYRLRGHGGELALLWADFLFRVFPVNKIMTEVYEFSERNLQLTKGMGFEQTAFIADHFWWEGHRWGVHHMTLTRERWKEYRQDFAGIIDMRRQYELATELSFDGRRED